jgi:hypothetical protein
MLPLLFSYSVKVFDMIFAAVRVSTDASSRSGGLASVGSS